MDYRLTTPPTLAADITLPASKSISNRLLLMAALCDRPVALSGLARCDDTRVMQAALTGDAEVIDVQGTGTAMRFLTALLAARPGTRVLTGNDRMRRRPVGPLVTALRSLGATISYEEGEGVPPLRIIGGTLHGGHVILPGDVSSQFASALMMVLPAVGGGSIRLTGPVRSRPYIHMTQALMREWGIEVDFHNDVITVPAGSYAPCPVTVEADWSAASYWLALAAIHPRARFILHGLHPHSLQGDSRMLEIARDWGVSTRQNDDSLLVESPVHKGKREACFRADMSPTPDLAPTVAVTLCLLQRPFSLTGLQSLRIKESDRLTALQALLARLGYAVTATDGILSWHGERIPLPDDPPVIDTLGDHRIAMAFAPAAVLHPGLVIRDAEVVTKSYPDFWLHLRVAGFTVTQV